MQAHRPCVPLLVGVAASDGPECDLVKIFPGWVLPFCPRVPPQPVVGALSVQASARGITLGSDVPSLLEAAGMPRRNDTSC